MTTPESPPTIVRLKAVGGSRRVRITTSDGAEHTYRSECIDLAGLGTGDPLDDAVLERLETEQQRLTIHDAALNLLDHRDRSVGEIRSRLRRRKFAASLIDSEVDRLQRAGLLDDHAFAKAWVSDRVRFAPRSRRMLIRELAQKGVAPDIAEAVTAHLLDVDTARTLAERKATTLRAHSPREIAKKVSSFLVHRGYEYALAARTAQQFANPDGDD